MYHCGVPLSDIQAMMGHDSIADTSIYIHVSDKLKQKEAFIAITSDNFFRHMDDFFNYRQDIYEISPQTLKSNRVDLDLFKNFICSQNLQTIDGPAVIDFQYYLKKLSARTS